ncbi:MAG: phosphotransferase family protein [Bacteroidota bacterium]
MQQATWLDSAVAVRQGEGLDTARLEAYLREHLGVSGPLTLGQFPGGYSNLTYLLSVAEAGRVREMVLRRPPFGAHIRGGHDMQREYRILSALIDTYGKVPRPILFCEDESIIGAPFYLMERVTGIILRNRLPEGLVLDPGLMQSICFALIDALAGLHALDYHAAGLSELGRPEGYTARQVDGWTKRYRDALTPDCPDFEPVAAWLAANAPSQSEAALIHNDFRYDNAILDPADLTHIIAILDWEMATIGDPLTDVGTTLAYWAEPEDPQVLRRFGLTSHPGNLDRQQFLERYAARSGRDVSDFLFYYVYGSFKNMVIALQIYARFRQGLTKDPRFAGLIQIVRAYHDLIGRALERGRISRLFQRQGWL